MTQKDAREFAEFPALVVAAFAVRNAAVLFVLVIWALITLTSV
jgi:hypothetical protein